eukprot:scaffold10259_cov155-Amphora_coffeaeformis.AAC.9
MAELRRNDDVYEAELVVNAEASFENNKRYQHIMNSRSEIWPNEENYGKERKSTHPRKTTMLNTGAKPPRHEHPYERIVHFGMDRTNNVSVAMISSDQFHPIGDKEA